MAVRDVVQAAAGSGGGGPEYVEDVFSTYLYTGNDSVNNIVNGIDLAGEGGLVWIKSRQSATNHALYDTERGVQKYLRSNTSEAQGTNTAGTHGLTSFNSDGFTLGDNQFGENSLDQILASWTFRKAPKFFDVVTWTGTGSAQDISHSLGSIPGCIIFKRTSSASNWAVYHRSVGNGSNLLLNTTDTSSVDSTVFNNTSPTSTVFTVGTSALTNANGSTYVAYVFAHDAGGFGEEEDQNIISCGSYTTNGSYIGPNVNLGYEPAWILVKNASGNGAWYIIDNMRGWTADGNVTLLNPNTSSAESTTTQFKLNATGFQDNGAFAGDATMIYIAIRRPMKTPESGTEVYAAYKNTSGTSEPTYISGFPVDFAINRSTLTSSDNNIVGTRLLQGSYLITNSTDAEGSSSSYQFDYNNGWRPTSSTNAFSWMFRRAPGFMDVVGYAGTSTASNSGQTQIINHNLGVAPEFIIVKRRTGASDWAIWHTEFAATTSHTFLDGSAELTNLPTYFFSTSGPQPTATQFTVGDAYYTNSTGHNYIAYLWASLPGVSKIGSYIGTGSDVNVDCGFSSGVRFVLIKRVDANSTLLGWFVYDSARGIVSGNDPYLGLNSTSAEVTSTDYIDPYSAGFTVTASAPADLNASGGKYFYLAIA